MRVALWRCREGGLAKEVSRRGVSRRRVSRRGVSRRGVSRRGVSRRGVSRRRSREAGLAKGGLAKEVSRGGSREGGSRSFAASQLLTASQLRSYFLGLPSPRNAIYIQLYTHVSIELSASTIKLKQTKLDQSYPQEARRWNQEAPGPRHSTSPGFFQNRPSMVKYYLGNRSENFNGTFFNGLLDHWTLQAQLKNTYNI